MRRAVWGFVLIVTFALPGGITQSQNTISVPVTIDRTNDILVISVGGNQSVSLEGFNITYEINGAEEPPIFLSDYPAFQPIDEVDTPRCFVIRSFQAQSPLPQTCAGLLAEQISTYSLSPSGIFWFDRAQFRQRPLIISKNDETVQVCQPEAVLCEFNFPATSPVPEQSTPPTPPGGPCTITDEMNLLVSPDTDGDGLSDFEENCVLRTDPTTAQPDSDGDGVIDDLELIFAQNNPAWANPSRADTDTDGDWLFDTIERELNLATDNVDTDGDALSDFIEFFWLGTEWLQANRDDDFNGFPDMLEVYLPPSLPEFTPCQANVTATVTRIFVADREEDNDPQEFIVGDEAEVTYALRDRTGNAGVQQRTWSQEGIQTGAEYTDIAPVGPITVTCGSVLDFEVSAIENDAPFGGLETLGEDTLVLPIVFQRIPIAHNLRTEQVFQFIGTSEDGFYDYQIYYTIEVIMLAN